MPRFPLRLLAAALCLLGAPAFAASSVELVEAGASPREPLRYRFENGRAERATLDTTLQMSIALGGQTMPMSAVPPIRMTMAMRVAEVATDGSARLEFELQNAEAVSSEAAAAAQINQLMAGLAGLAGWYRMDTQGRITEGALTRVPEGAAAGAADLVGDFRESMQQFAAPFPVEAVGNGARWRVQQNTDTGGVKVSQTAEYTLKSRRGRAVAVDVRIVDSKLEAGAALPAGAKMDAMKVEGGGTTELSLDSLVPRALIDLTTQVSMSMVAEGQTQSMTLDLKLQQKVAPATP